MLKPGGSVESFVSRGITINRQSRIESSVELMRQKRNGNTTSCCGSKRRAERAMLLP